MILATIDDSGVAARLKDLKKALNSGVPKATLDAGLELMRLSQLEVPHDEGTLQNSGTVELIMGSVVVGYHTAYAARLHEHPEYHFQKGRKGKYLEDPIRKNADVLGVKFGVSLGKELDSA